MKRVKLIMILGFLAALGFALHTSPAMAQTPTSETGLCTDGVDNDKDKLTDCADPDCSSDPACKEPPPGDLCHNIGGPDAKGGGANCDPDTVDPCCIETEEIGELCISGTQYFGIVISAGDQSRDAHIKHGDGLATSTFEALHLASDGQNHLGANVECVADRVNEQPPEPGN